jgi:enterochelin esterase-like enzyme
MARALTKNMKTQAFSDTADLMTPDKFPMHPDLKAFVDAGNYSNDAVKDFLANLSSPLSEKGALTFVWCGDALNVQLLRWIHGGVDTVTFTQLPGSCLWHLRVPVTDGGRFEYKLNIIGHQGEHWTLDPLNPNRAADPFGENSVAMTFGYQRPDWSIANGAPKGTLEGIDIESSVFGARRTEQVYLPHSYDPTHSYPLILVHDGGDYDDYAELTTSLDNLIALGDIPPVVTLLSQAGDRMSEYPRGRRHARYLVRELLPAVEARYSVSHSPADRVLLGASLGAVASLATAFRFPGVFGGLILKSGSFILDPEKLRGREHPVFHRVARMLKAMQRVPALPFTRAFVSTGELEGLADENKALAETLRKQGVEVRFQSSWDGHHWHNWRDQLRDALMWVLRPKRHQ